MKKVFKVLGIVFIVVVYCFTISTFYTGELNSSSKPTLENSKTVTLISANFNPIASQSEGAIQTNCPPLPSFKNPFKGFSLILQATEQLIVNTFSQYTTFSKNFLIRYQKIDIIFPFHYFW